MPRVPTRNSLLSRACRHWVTEYGKYVEGDVFHGNTEKNSWWQGQEDDGSSEQGLRTDGPVRYLEPEDAQ